MAEIVNLRRHRKAAERSAKAATAAENRIRFGRTKAERQRDAHEREQAARSLDGRKLEPESEG